MIADATRDDFEQRLRDLHEDYEGQGDVDRFVDRAKGVLWILRRPEEFAEDHTPPARLRSELARVENALRRLSSAGRIALNYPPRSAGEDASDEEFQEDARRKFAASRAQREMLAFTGEQDMVSEIMRRISLAKCQRKEDMLRSFLAQQAFHIVDSHGMRATSSTVGPYVGLLDALIGAAGMSYDARAIAREYVGD